MKDQDFLKSDLCQECGDEGFFPLNKDEWEQCEECEYLHRMEIRADIRLDELKEN